MASKVLVKDLVKALKYEVIYGNEFLENEITRDVVSRPGVEIYSGYFELYEYTRIQVIGTKEINLFYMLDEELRKERIDKLFSYNSPAFVFTKNVTSVPKEFELSSKKYGVPVLKSSHKTTLSVTEIGAYLSEELAEKKSFHGVMMEINGVGVMITGKSAMGKSETALQLLMRGHTLISADRVDISEPSMGLLIASCPELIERLLEVRGIGLIDVVDMFGVAAFRNKKSLNLIVELNEDSKESNMNRLSIEEEYEVIFGTKVPKVKVFVKPGRNLAALVEVATMNWKLKTFGCNASEKFINKINNIVNKKNN